MTIFQTPTSWEQLIKLIDHVVSKESYDEVYEYAVDIARTEEYADPVQQGRTWLEESPYVKNATDAWLIHVTLCIDTKTAGDLARARERVAEWLDGDRDDWLELKSWHFSQQGQQNCLVRIAEDGEIID